MSEYTIKKINYINATDKYTVVNAVLTDSSNNSSTVTLMTNDETNDNVFDNTTQKNMLSLKNGNIVYHNIYDSSKLLYQTAIYEKTKFDQQGNTYDFHGIFQHGNPPEILTSFQINNIIYALTDKSPYGRCSLNMDSYSYLSQDNGYYTIPNIKIETPLYNKSSIQQFLDNYSISSNTLSNSISKTIYKINYQTIYEFPGNLQNDYYSGNWLANMYKTKNHLNSEYSMEIDSSIGTNSILNYTRNYIGAGHNNNQVYLKYYDNKHYKKNSEDIEKNTITAEEITTIKQKYDLKCQHIEILHDMGRYVMPNGHTSNLYSVKLETDMLKSSALSAIAPIVKTQIKSTIKQILNRLAPIHTQLFQVEIQDR